MNRLFDYARLQEKEIRSRIKIKIRSRSDTTVLARTDNEIDQ
jgi:hypothetical protein